MGVTDFVGIVDSKGQRELAVPFSHSMHTHICTGSSAATAYLTADVLSRPNLTVAVSVMTEKILFDSSSSEPRAIGVELSTSPTSTRYCARATREVILCAGAVGSPQLLMLSGVGPAQELQELEIPLVKDLSAVGKNLYDVNHPLSIKFLTEIQCVAYLIWSPHISCDPWDHLGLSQQTIFGCDGSN